jgi:hypothetical protein
VQQRVLGDLDPEVHRVGHHELRVRDLVEGLVLHARLGVGQEQVLGRPAALGDLRVEVLEHVQVRRQRAARVPVGLVAPAPAEGLAAGDLQAAGVDPAAGQEVEVLLLEVAADDPDQVERPERARGGREVGRRAAEDVGAAVGCGLDRVVGQGSDDEERHGGDLEFYCISCSCSISARTSLPPGSSRKIPPERLSATVSRR